MDSARCIHSLVDNLKIDTSEVDKLSLTIYPFDEYGNTVATETSFDVKAKLNGAAFWNDTVVSGSNASIPIQESLTGDIIIVMTLKGQHIKGSPHTIEAFTPMNEVLDANTVVTAVLGGGAFVFISFAVYKAATKKGRENVMDEVTEARKCLLPFVLDIIDIATDVGELGKQELGRGDLDTSVLTSILFLTHTLQTVNYLNVGRFCDLWKTYYAIFFVTSLVSAFLVMAVNLVS